jgi:hypothetical protein
LISDIHLYRYTKNPAELVFVLLFLLCPPDLIHLHAFSSGGTCFVLFLLLDPPDLRHPLISIHQKMRRNLFLFCFCCWIRRISDIHLYRYTKDTRGTCFLFCFSCRDLRISFSYLRLVQAKPVFVAGSAGFQTSTCIDTPKSPAELVFVLILLLCLQDLVHLPAVSCGGTCFSFVFVAGSAASHTSTYIDTPKNAAELVFVFLPDLPDFVHLTTFRYDGTSFCFFLFLTRQPPNLAAAAKFGCAVNPPEKNSASRKSAVKKYAAATEFFSAYFRRRRKSRSKHY